MGVTSGLRRCLKCGDGRNFLVLRADDKAVPGKDCMDIDLESDLGVVISMAQPRNACNFDVIGGRESGVSDIPV